MMKKKGKGRIKGGKTKRTARKRPPSKPIDPNKVRQELAGIVKTQAKKITRAVALKACQGDLAPAKYLFEMAHIYPQPPEGTVSAEDEESFAKTLLDRLNIPESPVIHDLYENGEDVMLIPPRADGETPSEEQASGDCKDEEMVESK